MNYIALYRKYRPQTFKEVVEQDTIVKILRQALKQKKIAHAYLFAGPKGSGKTTVARIFAKGLNCENGPTDEPCMSCNNCQGITNGTNLDVVEIDAASNRGIDEIRDLKEKIYYVPVYSKYKVYIIDEAHMLTIQAFNALLKTLEEPPSNVVFILATTEPEKIPATIISRCERFYFKPISIDGLFNKIKEVANKEHASITDGAALLIARFASGSLRNALSILDQAITLYDNEIKEDNIRALLDIPDENVFSKLLLSIVRGEVSEILKLINMAKESGRDAKAFLNELIEYIQDMITGKVLNDFKPLESKRDPNFIEVMREQSRYFSLRQLNEYANKYLDTINKLKLYQDSYFPILLTSLELAKVEAVATVEPTVEREEVVTPEVVEEITISGVEEAPLVEKELSESIITIEQVKARWGEILNIVKGRNAPLYAILLRVNPVEIHEDTISLLPEKKFYLTMLRTSENTDMLLEAIKKVIGKEFKINFVEPGEEVILSKEEKIEQIKQKKEVQEILKLFDGTITDVKDFEEER